MATIDDIRMGECEVLEFKQELPQKDRQLLKTVVAFALFAYVALTLNSISKKFPKK